jgi:hypothetical protein
MRRTASFTNFFSTLSTQAPIGAGEKHMNKAGLPVILSSLIALMFANPGLADTYANSTAAQGNENNSTGNLTGTQTEDNAEACRTVTLPQADYSLLAPNSVNNNPYPSDQFTYGFPMEGSAPFMGVDHGSYGGTLPATSTSSVNLNSVQLPWIRLPNEGDGVFGGCGGGCAGPGITINLGGGGPTVNLGANLGGVNVNATVNLGQSLDRAANSPQNFFNSGCGGCGD